MYAKEIYSRHHLNIRTMDDTCLEKLRTEQCGERKIVDFANYDILSNHFYQSKLQYLPLNQRSSEIDFVGSDIIARMLYLGEDNVLNKDKKPKSADLNSKQLVI